MIENKINSYEKLRNNIPALIEVFVNYYGEEERENITRKFSNTLYIGYVRYEDYSLIANEINNESKDIATKEFFEKIGIEWNEENINKYIGSNFSGFKDCFYKFFNNYNRESNYSKNEVLESLKTFFDKEDLSYDSPEFQSLFNQMLEYKDEYIKALNRYNELNDRYKDFFEAKKNIENYTHSLDAKYMDKLLKELRPFMSEHDINIIDNQEGYYKLECKDLLIGYKFSSETLIDAFSQESVDLLNNSETPKYKIDNIIRDRIEYFNKIGIDLGNDYEDYLNDENVKNNTPTVEFANKIIEIRTRLIKEYKKEEYYNRPDLAKIREEVQKYNFTSKEVVSYYIPEKSKTCVSPNYIETENGFEPFSTLYFDTNIDYPYIDCTLIHELNHLYELEYLECDGEQVKFVSGWDIIESKCLKDEEKAIDEIDIEDKTHRPYELLNEITNELIAQDITKSMHENNIYLYSDEEHSKLSSGTSYENAKRLVLPFYEEFKDDIIASRKGNMQVLFDAVGEENFMQLNTLVSNYLEYFSGFKIYNTIDSIQKGETNEDVEYFYECHNKGKEIIQNMRNNKTENISK